MELALQPFPNLRYWTFSPKLELKISTLLKIKRLTADTILRLCKLFFEENILHQIAVALFLEHYYTASQICI